LIDLKALKEEQSCALKLERLAPEPSTKHDATEAPTTIQNRVVLSCRLKNWYAPTDVLCWWPCGPRVYRCRHWGAMIWRRRGSTPASLETFVFGQLFVLTARKSSRRVNPPEVTSTSSLEECRNRNLCIRSILIAGVICRLE